MIGTWPLVPSGCHHRGDVTSASGGIFPAAINRTAASMFSRPHPEIWSHPAVVMNRCEAGSVVAKLFGGPHPSAPSGLVPHLGVEKSMSSAAMRRSCLASSAESGRPAPSEAGWITPWSTALRAAEYSSPAMPEDCPVASEEHDDDSTESHV